MFCRDGRHGWPGDLKPYIWATWFSKLPPGGNATRPIAHVGGLHQCPGVHFLHELLTVGSPGSIWRHLAPLSPWPPPRRLPPSLNLAASFSLGKPIGNSRDSEGGGDNRCPPCHCGAPLRVGLATCYSRRALCLSASQGGPRYQAPSRLTPRMGVVHGCSDAKYGTHKNARAIPYSEFATSVAQTLLSLHLCGQPLASYVKIPHTTSTALARVNPWTAIGQNPVIIVMVT